MFAVNQPVSINSEVLCMPYYVQVDMAIREDDDDVRNCFGVERDPLPLDILDPKYVLGGSSDSVS